MNELMTHHTTQDCTMHIGAQYGVLTTVTADDRAKRNAWCNPNTYANKLSY